LTTVILDEQIGENEKNEDIENDGKDDGGPEEDGRMNWARKHGQTRVLQEVQFPSIVRGQCLDPKRDGIT